MLSTRAEAPPNPRFRLSLQVFLERDVDPNNLVCLCRRFLERPIELFIPSSWP